MDYNQSPEFLRGAMLLLHDYLGLRRGDQLLIRISQDAWHADRGRTIQSLLAIAKDATIETRVEEVGPDTIFDAEEIKRATATIYATRTVSYHRRELKSLIDSMLPDPPKIMRLFDFSAELFEIGISKPRIEQHRLNNALIRRISNGKELVATSKSGTDLHIDVSGIASWTNSYGKCGSKFVGVLPTGEINAFCPRINGVFHLSGAVNSNFGWIDDARLNEGDLVLEIENGILTNFRTNRLDLEMALQSFLEIENAARVGELGIGTNMGIGAFVPFVSHINERYPGLHLGFGTPTQVGDAAAWPCPVHLDFIARDCDLHLDGVPLFVGREFANLEYFPDRQEANDLVGNLVDTT